MKFKSKHVKVFKEMLKEKHEVGGILTFKNNVSQEISNISKGNKSEVLVPRGEYNFHTHPKFCYTDENAILGWPSGEDLREAIKFSLNGTRAHFVITLEGIYTIRVNPKIINILKKLSNERRGFALGILETYFQSTHIFRTKDFDRYLKKSKGRHVKPQDFLDFVNNFNVNQVNGNDKCESLLSCPGQVPIFKLNCKKKCYVQMPIREYIQYYSNDLYAIDKNGQDVGLLDSTRLLKYFDTVVKKLKTRGNVFKVEFYSW